ncbi:MAG: glycosyltransferase [Bifidobacterium sp.]|jgi:glycosyltransferase EpsF|nr:glycosyltransferase [Bifidobacterium sp.]
MGKASRLRSEGDGFLHKHLHTVRSSSGWLVSMLESPVSMLTVASPYLLPDFYLWKIDFDVDKNKYLVVFWFVGVLLKYVALFLAATYFVLVANRRQRKLIGLFLLPFAIISVSGLFHGFGLSGLYDTWNQMLLGLPAMLYFPAVLSKKQNRTERTKSLTILYIICLIIVIITIAMYIVYPKGFGQAFGSCDFVSGARICDTFIGRHTDTTLYGIMLVVLALSLNEYHRSVAAISTALVACILLLYFSTSATAKAISILIAFVAVSLVLIKNMKKVINSLLYLANPLVINIFGIIFPFLATYFVSRPIVSSLLLKLGRDTTMTGRQALYQEAIKIFRANPLFGTGYDQDYFQAVMINNFNQHLPFPHNSYLQILMEGGLLCLIAFLFLTQFVNDSVSSSLSSYAKLRFRFVYIFCVISASFTGDFFVARFFLILSILFSMNSISFDSNKTNTDINKTITVKPTKIHNAKNKNILLFMSKLDMGGIEKLYLSVIPSLLNEFTFIIVWYGRGENELQTEFQGLCEKVIHLSCNRYLHPIKFVKELRKVITIENIDVFHSNVGFSTFYGLLASRLSNVPIRVAHSHNGEFGVPNNPFNIFFRFLCKLSCHYFATTRINIGSVSANALFFKSDPSLFVPNGIDLQHFRYNPLLRTSIRRSLDIANDTDMLLHIGRFTRQKNHEFLIRTFYEFHRRNKNSRLVLVGDGELSDRIHLLIKKYSLDDSVSFLGLVSDPAPLYSAADCFVFPSLYEGLPITLIEAQANGLRIVASDKIDNVAKATNLIHFESLDESPSVWSKVIEDKISSRTEVELPISLLKFDFSYTVDQLRKIYKGEI